MLPEPQSYHAVPGGCPAPASAWSRWLWTMLRGLLISGAVAAVLLLTYQHCIGCVLAVAVFAALTMNCVPMMPLVFLMSLLVLLTHAIDYDRASLRVEVPLQDMVYVPTWDDVQKYVHIAPKDPPP